MGYVSFVILNRIQIKYYMVEYMLGYNHFTDVVLNSICMLDLL